MKIVTSPIPVRRMAAVVIASVSLPDGMTELAFDNRQKTKGIRRCTRSHSIGEGPGSCDGWHPGPIPLGLSTSSPTIANVSARGTYVSTPTQRLVLGSEDESTATRFWAFLDPDHTRTPIGSTCWAVEMVRRLDIDRNDGHGDHEHLAILHFSGPTGLTFDQTLVESVAECSLQSLISSTSLSELAETESPLRLVRSLIPLRRKNRIVEHRLVFVTPMTHDPLTPAIPWLTSRPLDQWLRTIATATLPKSLVQKIRSVGRETRVRDYELDDEVLNDELAVPHVLIRPSADWRILVMRDGSSFIGMRQDEGIDTSRLYWSRGVLVAQGSDDFFDFAELYVRTIFADSIVLGAIQRAALGDLSDSVQRVLVSSSAGARAVKECDDLEFKLGRFREQLWWENAATSGLANDLLRGFHEQHNMRNRLTQVTNDIRERTMRIRTSSQVRTETYLFLLSAFGPFVAFGLAVVSTFQSDFQTWKAKALFLGGSIVGSLLLGALFWMSIPATRTRLFSTLKGDKRQ